MRRKYYRFTVHGGVEHYPKRAWSIACKRIHVAFVFIATVLVAILGLLQAPNLGHLASQNIMSVPGESYQICNEGSQYLTSQWSYDTPLDSSSPNYNNDSESFSVTDYENLPGYGTTLPPLPSYISDQNPSTTAAVIFAPGSTNIQSAAYNFPNTPIIYYFEGGSYGEIGLQSISGDEFIGGSAPGFAEPEFDDGGNAAGITSGNDTYSYSGGVNSLASAANIGDTTISLSSDPTPYAGYITFADGSTYSIKLINGTAVTLNNPLTAGEIQGSAAWTNSTPPIATVGSAGSQGDTVVTLNASSVPLVEWGNVVLGTDDYEVNQVSGSQSNYSLTFNGGLDYAIAANTPVYYNAQAGDVTVDYLNISNDLHSTTGTITLGSGWTLEHNDLHDFYQNGVEGAGVAYYGGDESTIEYNCFSKMGSSGAGGGGTGEVFDYNEVYEAGYEGDPNCGCTGDKWWGTLNADIIDNSFIEVGLGASTPAIWLDNGNTGTNISGNYFYKNVGIGIESETGYNLNVTDNLFEDDDWGSGNGCGDSNCTGEIGINSSGGFDIPNSRYNDEINIANNQFFNDWGGVTIWESGLRNCASSGEGFPIDAAYCSGGFPTTDTSAGGDDYYFSHETNSLMGDTTTLDQTANIGDGTILTRGPEAIGDQIGFSDQASTTTTDTTDVTTFNGSQSINVSSTTGFPSSGELRVDTSNAGGGGGLTGAILSYNGTSTTTFNNVSFIRGSGQLGIDSIGGGPEATTVTQVQPYTVSSETCFANDCALTVSPHIASTEATGATVTSTGTCALYNTAASTPTGPMAPVATNSPYYRSYYDGCQWGTKQITISGNDFEISPSYINSQTADAGGATSCTPANQCGTNFMAFQDGGDLPYGTNIDGNAMMSNSSFTTCPIWDGTCSTDPLNNLNALSDAPYAPGNNGEAPSNNLWSNNTYHGPWTWNAFNYGPCDALPTDPNNGNTIPSSPNPCYNLAFSDWQGDWQQDSGSTYNPMVVSLNTLSTNQEIHGSAQSVGAYEDTASTNTISSTLSVNSSNVNTSNVPSSPYDFSLNTLNYKDGQYTIKVSATDSGGNSDSDSVPVYVSNGDLNGDGKINISDLAIMAAHWGQSDSNYGDGNITGQSKINISDLAVLAANWQWSD